MVLTLAVPARAFLGLKDLITLRHIENMNRILLATGMMVGYAYLTELFTAWYSQHHYEQFVFLNRALGPYSWAFWLMIFCNVISPQLLWFRWARTSMIATFAVAMCVNAGMWFERFVIIVTSLHRDFLPSSWGMYAPTWVDIAMFAGSFGLFFTLFLLFLKFLPVVAMAEVKTVLPEAHPHGHGHGEYGPGQAEGGVRTTGHGQQGIGSDYQRL
jgi:molybdopterin-containing oxidoreductase family membrane subunit